MIKFIFILSGIKASLRGSKPLHNWKKGLLRWARLQISEPINFLTRLIYGRKTVAEDGFLFCQSWSPVIVKEPFE